MAQVNRLKRGLLLTGICLSGAVVLISGFIAFQATLVLADCFVAHEKLRG